MRMIRLSLMAVAVAWSNIAAAQTPVYPPEGYSALLFDPVDTKYVFRLNGAPWICRGDTFCKPVKIEGVADKDLAQATIEPLGVAGARYLLSYKQANLEKGKEVALSCREERCVRLDSIVGDTSPLGTFEARQGDRAVTRAALLRQLDGANRRAQLLWCTEADCAELPLTRDAAQHLSYMGSGRKDGRTLAWLRDQTGAVLSCGQAEEGVSDQLTCEKTTLVLADFPAAAMAAATPPPPVPPAAVVSTVSNAAREAQLRQTEARRLIVEARRFAQVGDFAHAEQMLQEADRQAPGFAETAKARAEIASLRTERAERFRERYQYVAAIDQALASEQMWEAERLLTEYAQRFNQDEDYRMRSSRLAQLRAAGPYQARVNEARAHVATARQAMERGDFVEAERQLAIADRSAPGFPEVGQARADLSRRRIAAERQQDDLRLILAAIDQAFQRKQYDEADRAIADGRRRYGSYAGWTDLQSRAASARRGDDRQANELRTQNARALELVAAARRSTTQGDFAAADKALNDAHALSANMPEVAIARAELERAKADHARIDAEVRAVAASVDAAIARKQYADAERLIADGQKRYPTYAGWADLSRRLADARRATPTQTGNAPMAPQQQAAPAAPPSAAPAPPLQQATPAAPAPNTAPTPPPARPTQQASPTAPAPPAPAPTPPTQQAAPAAPAAPGAAPAPAQAHSSQLARLVAAARDAIRRLDFTAAERDVAEAEKIDAKAEAVVDVRAELKAAEDKAKASPALPPLPPPRRN